MDDRGWDNRVPCNPGSTVFRLTNSPEQGEPPRRFPTAEGIFYIFQSNGLRNDYRTLAGLEACSRLRAAVGRAAGNGGALIVSVFLEIFNEARLDQRAREELIFQRGGYERHLIPSPFAACPPPGRKCHQNSTGAGTRYPVLSISRSRPSIHIGFYQIGVQFSRARGATGNEVGRKSAQGRESRRAGERGK